MKVYDDFIKSIREGDRKVYGDNRRKKIGHKLGIVEVDDKHMEIIIPFHPLLDMFKVSCNKRLKREKCHISPQRNTIDFNRDCKRKS